MEARAIIAALRDGKGLDPAAARWFAAGLASGEVTDAQAGAFAMAVFLKGTGAAGRVALTEGMRDSGQVLRWSLPGPVVDKHSTGGIGDSTSLLLAPALAACGAYVPMISGRGLGHTGGTLDKLESIPGYNPNIPTEALQDLVGRLGCAIIGATGSIAPADKRLYLIRDISGTVESIDLITASILSKKLSAGLDALILDVKCGSGAFMKTPETARALAESLVGTAQGAGCRTAALITDMSQPLGLCAGNAVEVRECMDTLTGVSVSLRLWEVTVALGAEALVLAGLAETVGEGAARIAEALETGRAAEIFGRMVAELGGPRDFLENYDQHLPEARVVAEVPALADGFVTAVDAEALGHAVVHLGGGRLRDGDKLDMSVGLTELATVGEEYAEGEPLALVHAADEAGAARAVAAVQAAYRLAAEAPQEPDLIQERVG